MATPGKAAPRLSLAVGRERISTVSKAKSRHDEAVRPVSHPRVAAGHKARVSPISERPQSDIQYQTVIKNFETGVRAFQKQNYGKAAEIFEKLIDSDARDVAERAQMHLRLCRQRSGRLARPPKSADEYYAMGIACLNARNLEQAVEHLSKADKMKPNQDHVRYALAVSHALEGNIETAFAHLEAAFALRPENRIHARRDEDFQGIAADPRFRRLTYPSGSQ